MISIRSKFLFIHVPKTGGNSIQRALVGFSDDRLVKLHPFQDGFERFELRNDQYETHKHSTLRDYQRMLPAEQFSGLFKFATLRNPWERMVSMYFSPHRGVSQWNRDDFVRLIRDTPPAAHYLSTGDGDTLGAGLDRLLRFERLQEDFASVCQSLGLGPSKLPHVNASERRHYCHYYDDETKALVAQRCADEIQLGNYVFN